jgi:hypothetical protein
MPTKLDQSQIDGLSEDLSSLDSIDVSLETKISKEDSINDSVDASLETKISKEYSINDSVDASLATSISGKQNTLVSGTNIKTINGSSILGSGNLNVTATSNPKLLGFSGVAGTQTSSTNVTICHSLLIPANTLGTNNILQLVFRMFRQSGNTGQLYGRIYFNTTNSLTGAVLFNTIFTMNGGGSQYLGYVERNFGYNGTTLTSYSNTAYSEYTTGTVLSVNLNRTVDNYILFTMQAQNSGDIGNIDMFKTFIYA